MIDLSLDSNVFIYNEFDEALQELDLMLNTTYTELLGYPQFGTDFEQFSWQMNPEINAIKEYIKENINKTLFLRNFRTEINVNVMKGEYRLIYNVEINVYDTNNNVATRKYQFR